MESSKQEMELFHPFLHLGSNKFFKNMMLIWAKDSKTSFRNRKWNLKQEMELFHPFALIGSTNLFWNMMFIWSNDSKICFINWKWNFLNRKYNNFTHVCSSDQKTSLETDVHLIQGFQNKFLKQEMELYHLFLNRIWNYFTNL